MSSSHDNLFLEHHKFQDDVWGKILLSDLERDVIDTPEFQRLFRTSQLGFVDLVYQTANHTRGAHSIGACHVANILLENLEKNTEPSINNRHADIRITQAERVLIRLGALLHDISHVPLSHDIERKKHQIEYNDKEIIKMPSYYGQYDKHDDFKSNPLLYILLLDSNRSVLARLLQNYSKDFYDLLKKSPDDSHLSDFISLLRDAEQNGWTPSKLILPNLLFHLLTVEVPETEGMRASFEVLRDFQTKPEPWGLGPKESWNEFHKAWYQPFRHDIIGNTLSADLIDYLRRDPQRLGMNRRIDLHILNHYVLIFDDLLTKTFRSEMKDSGSKKMYRCAIDLLDDKRGTNRVVALNDLFRLLDLRHEIHEKAVMHRVVQSAIAMLSRALLLLDDKKPTLSEIVEVDTAQHPLQGEDLFFSKLLAKCDEKSNAGAAACALLHKIIDRRVYRPLMIIPGDRAAKRFEIGKSDTPLDPTEFCLRTLATIVDSRYYSPFLLFVCACMEKMLQGIFQDDAEVCQYAKKTVSDGSGHAVAAMEVVPSRVIIWTMPFKQLYKDPAIMVALKDGVTRLDELARAPEKVGEDQSVQNVAKTSIKQADSKYAAMWKLYVFLSDSLFYTGILEKLIDPDVDPASSRCRQKTLLENATAFFVAAFKVVFDNWSETCELRKSRDQRQQFLLSQMENQRFASLVERWIASYRDRTRTTPEGGKADPSFGLSTVNLDRYVHEWDAHKGRPAENCRDIRYKADKSSEDVFLNAQANPDSNEGRLLTVLKSCGISKIDNLSEKEFLHLVALFANNADRCEALVANGAAREVVLKSLWDGDLPGLFSEPIEPSVRIIPPKELVHDLPELVGREQIAKWFHRETSVFTSHVQAGLLKEIDSFVDVVEMVPGKKRMEFLDDVHRRILNESKFVFNRLKQDEFAEWLRKKRDELGGLSKK